VEVEAGNADADDEADDAEEETGANVDVEVTAGEADSAIGDDAMVAEAGIEPEDSCEDGKLECTMTLEPFKDPECLESDGGSDDEVI
jgi:hypothetical protein